jgi:hypothetical protein
MPSRPLLLKSPTAIEFAARPTAMGEPAEGVKVPSPLPSKMVGVLSLFASPPGVHHKIGFLSNSKPGGGVWQLYGENRCRNSLGPANCIKHHGCCAGR